MDKLELIQLSKNFTVDKKEDGYEVEHRDYNLAAFISKDKNIKYYVTGVYNSGLDWQEVNYKGLKEIQRFCELVI